MKPEHWQRLETLFHEALEQPASGREAWLREQCGDDRDLLSEMLELLAAAAEETCRVERAVARSAMNVSRHPEPPAERRLGPYRITATLGSGGMGSVYLAVRDDRQFRQQVAIKLIRGFPDDDSLRRLRQERQILADLNHPNIARLLDGGTTGDGQPFLVMEHIEGERIDRWCRDHMPAHTARVRLFQQVCDAVHYAHQHLIIHRDIKPGNILVTADGRPVLLDFGIAKLIETGETTVAAEGTEKSTRYFTPGYASPEQQAGERITTATDIYSLGRLLMTLLDVTPPDPAAATADQVALFRRTAWRRDLPSDLVAIIDQACHLDPNRRYASVEALRADIQRYLQGRPVEAAPDTLRYRLGKFISRNRAAVAAGAAAVFIGTAMIIGLVRGYERARLAEHQAVLEAATATQVTDFLVSLFDAADPRVAQGTDLRVSEVLARGRDRIDQGAGLDPQLRARLLYTLGMVYVYLEDVDAATSLLTEAAELYRGRAGPAPQEEARALYGLGTVYLRINQAEQVEADLARAMALVESGQITDLRLVSDAHNQWGLLQLERADLAEARSHLERALALRRELGDQALESHTMHNLALLEQRAGRTDLAVRQFEETLAYKAEIMGTRHPSYLNSLRSLISALQDAGEIHRALALGPELVRGTREIYGDDHPLVAKETNLLAGSYHDLGQYDRALEMYGQALALLGGREHPADASEAARLINNMAAAHEDRGDPAGAEPLFRESLALRQGLYTEDSLDIARAEYNLGRVLIALHRPAEAEQHLETALTMRAARLDDDHIDVLAARGLLYEARARQGHEPSWDAFGQTMQQLRASLAPGSFRRLAVELRLARALLDQGSADQAGRLLASLVPDFTQRFGTDHPLVLEAELEQIRAELMQAPQPDHQSDHLLQIERIAGGLEAVLHPQARALHLATCLRHANTAPPCWRRLPASEQSAIVPQAEPLNPAEN